MRTLLKSFSLAALFSLATACAVDEATQISDEAASDDSLGDDDDGATFPTLDPRGKDEKKVAGDDRAELPPQREPFHDRDWMTDLGEHLDDVVGYCEQDYDCKSNICDQKNSVCRDYPF